MISPARVGQIPKACDFAKKLRRNMIAVIVGALIGGALAAMNYTAYILFGVQRYPDPRFRKAYLRVGVRRAAIWGTMTGIIVYLASRPLHWI